jgi:hypothetical protein
MILEDDNYKLVEDRDVRAGDTVLYMNDDGGITHSGLVLELVGPYKVPRILSKWGGGPEAVHLSTDVPQLYGRILKYYRCTS